MQKNGTFCRWSPAAD